MTKSINLDQVGDEIVSLAESLSSLKFRLLTLIGEVDASGKWETTGAITCAHWLAQLADWEVGTAREHVRVARKLRQLPNTAKEFKKGEIPYSKVRQTTRVATPETEKEVLEIAATTPTSELPRTLANWRQAKFPEETARLQEAERGVVANTSLTGSVVIKATLPPEEASMVISWLDRQKVDASRDAPTRTFSQRRADALIGLATGGSSPKDTQVILHYNQDGPELPDGTLINPKTAKWLGCEPTVTPITYKNGSPADVGRKKRLVTPKLKRLVRERDQHCQFPGCSSRRFTEVHHIKHWSDGGPTNLENLLLLCGHHHRWVHDNGWPSRKPVAS